MVEPLTSSAPVTAAEPRDTTFEAAVAAVPDALLDEAIAHLQALSHGALVDYAVAIGRYIVQTFYDGNVGAFHDRSRGKDVPLLALCRRRGDELAAMGLSRSTLQRYVYAYDAFRTLPEEVRARLTLRSLEQLRRVQEPIARTELALAAARQGWSPRRIAAEVENAVAALTPTGPTRGRPRLEPGERALRALVRQARVAAEQGPELGRIKPARLAKLRAELEAALRALDGVWRV